MGDKIVENITELLLEVIGYLTPTIYMMSILKLILPSNEILFPKILNNELVLIISLYGFGYLLRSISIWIGSWGFFDLKRKTNEEFKNNELFVLVKEDLKKKNLIGEATNYNEVRSICLGMYQEISNKVYLFMFRSSLFFDLFIINAFIVLVFIIDCLFSYSIFENSIEHKFMVLFLALSLYPLLKTRKRFFKISYKLPIRYYISKQALS